MMITEEMEGRLRTSAENHALSRAVRESASMFVYRGLRGEVPVYYVRSEEEGTPAGAELVATVEPGGRF
jgi:hypothetical protein